MRTRAARSRRIVVLCPYPPDRAPSQRLKFEQYYDDWRSHGWTVDVRPFWDEAAWRILYQPNHRGEKLRALARGLVRRRRDLEDALAADLVYLHLEAAPVGPPWIERRIARAGVPVVYDVDDLVHLPYGSRANPFMRLLRGSGKVPELLGLARQVIVCTPYLVLCSQSLFRFADLGDDGLCRGGPDKGCGVIVSAIDVVVDRLD